MIFVILYKNINSENEGRNGWIGWCCEILSFYTSIIQPHQAIASRATEQTILIHSITRGMQRLWWAYRGKNQGGSSRVMEVRSELPRWADCVRCDLKETGKERFEKKMRCKEKEVEIFNNPCSGKKSHIACFWDAGLSSNIRILLFYRVQGLIELSWESHLTRSVNEHSSCFADTLLFTITFIMPFTPFNPHKNLVHTSGKVMIWHHVFISWFGISKPKWLAIEKMTNYQESALQNFFLSHPCCLHLM